MRLKTVSWPQAFFQMVHLETLVRILHRRLLTGSVTQEAGQMRWTTPTQPLGKLMKLFLSSRHLLHSGNISHFTGGVTSVLLRLVTPCSDSGASESL